MNFKMSKILTKQQRLELVEYTDMTAGWTDTDRWTKASQLKY